VKALDLQDGWLYVGGRFTKVSGAGSGDITVGRAARLRASDGRPDGTWKPQFDGTVIDIDASARGDRVYVVGYFTKVNGVSQPQMGAISTVTGAPSVVGMAPWQPSVGSVARYQQAILEVGDNVWQGGSEHVLSQYSRSDYLRLRSNITKAGGDFQSLATINGVVYASCHCGDWVYNDTLNYSSPVGSASDVHAINYIGAWDASTGEYLSDFGISGLDARSGIGPFAMTVDTNECLWFGGDLRRGSWLGSDYQWLGGFGKVCGRDSAPPTVPGPLSVTATQGGTLLSWGASNDTSGNVQYEVLRDDRVVATVDDTSWIGSSLGLAEYWVRAIDAEGNRSASTTGVSPAPFQALSGSVLFADTWAGADDMPWAAEWAIGARDGVADVHGGAGRLANSDVAGSYARAQLTGSASLEDSETLLSYHWGEATAAASFSVTVRGSGGWQNAYRPRNGYGVELSSKSATVSVTRNLEGALTLLQSAAGAQQVSSAKQWLRMRVSGSRVQVRLWVDGQPEPQTWNITVTDTGLSSRGQLFVSLARGATSVGAKEIFIDALVVSDGS
jgi:hypothetical protein